MKKSIISFIIIGIILFFVANTGFAQQTTKEFKVFGNCGMCKTRIEKAAKTVSGVESAVWDKETKMIQVTMAEQVNIVDVVSAIEAVGHDTEFNKASQTVYDGLPGCCKYDREDSSEVGASKASVVASFSFLVSGNCGMCKTRIEKAAKTVSGVESAVWDKESKIITVETTTNAIGKTDVSKAIALVGHDTEFDKADQMAYDNLPGCCLYDRNQ
jgi:copper chaperone CopZ